MTLQSSAAVWQSRWPSWAPVPKKPTVSVDLKLNQRLITFVFFPKLRCFVCPLRSVLLLYVYSLFFHSITGYLEGSELIGQCWLKTYTVQDNRKIKGKSLRHTQSWVLQLFIETYSRNMFTSLVDVNILPPKLAGTLTRNVYTCTIDKQSSFSLFFIIIKGYTIYIHIYICKKVYV